jgi:hypothetical protein
MAWELTGWGGIVGWGCHRRGASRVNGVKT